MSKLFSRVVGFFTSRSFVGVDKSGNRYFTRNEEIDGFVKEKRWVIFKGEQDPTSIPVEWICWLNGQRKKAPTPEEMVELEARRERVRQNAALLKQEEERKYSIQQSKSSGKVGSPDLKSFIRQFPEASSEQNRGKGHEEISETGDSINKKDRTSEPSGSGEYFQPGTWQPPT